MFSEETLEYGQTIELECNTNGILYYIASTNETAIKSVTNYEEIKQDTLDSFISENYSLPIPSQL